MSQPDQVLPITPAAPLESPAALFALIASGVVWGLMWLPLKFFASLGLTGHTIGLTAYAMVAVVSLPMILRERAQWRAEWGWLLLIGLFFGCANLAFTASLTMGSVVRAMLLFYLLPAWGAIGGALFLREHLGARRLLAVALSLGGVFVIMGGPAVWESPLSLADAMALAAGFCYTAASIANRKAQAIPMMSRTLITFIGCTLIALIALPFASPVIPVLSPFNWLMLALFAFIWLLGGNLLTTYGVTHIEASRAAILQVIELLVAVLSAILLGGEHLSLIECVGAVMIVAATVIEATTPA